MKLYVIGVIGGQYTFILQEIGGNWGKSEIGAKSGEIGKSGDSILIKSGDTYRSRSLCSLRFRDMSPISPYFHDADILHRV